MNLNLLCGNMVLSIAEAIQQAMKCGRIVRVKLLQFHVAEKLKWEFYGSLKESILKNKLWKC